MEATASNASAGPTAADATRPVADTGERAFDVEELFFSTTDERGFIRSYNDVFVRISGYEADDLLGAPHNVIRHPDMPRVVFRLLWDSIKAGESIVAYVKNKAADGAHYWVLAAVRPIDGGYLSVRLKPTSPLFTSVKQLYAELLEIEQRIESSGGRRSDAMDVSAERLTAFLAENELADYQEFMRSALTTEVLGRRSLLAARRGGSLFERLDRSTDPAEAVRARIDAELEAMKRYVALSDDLAQHSKALIELAGEGRVLALNAVLASRRLGSDGAALSAIAGLMQQTFPIVGERSAVVVDQITTSRKALQQLGFEVSLASLQADMTALFVEEMHRTGNHAGDASVRLLIECLRRDIDAMLTTTARVVDGLGGVSGHAVGLLRELRRLTAIQRNGRIEATRTEGATAFRSLLANTLDRIDAAEREVDEVQSLAARLDTGQVTQLAADLAGDLDALEAAEFAANEFAADEFARV